MRAKEFINEVKRGKPLDAHSKVSVGSGFTNDGLYDLYRASLIMARCPGDLDDIDPYSFVTKRPMLVTYTEEEREKIEAAFKKLGVKFELYMDQGSEEPEAINKVSPIKGFKGY